VGVIGEVQEAVKAFGEIAVKPLLAVSAASAFLLFTPAPWIGALGMTKFVVEYRSWVGVAFVISLAYLFAHAALSTFDVSGRCEPLHGLCQRSEGH
jgi:hypothetical protein